MGTPRMEEAEATKAMMMLSSTISKEIDEIATPEPTETTVSNSEESDTPLSAMVPSTTSSNSSQLLVNDGDVICGRGKMAFHHVGNVRFRESVAKSVEMYQRAEKRLGKPVIVQSIIDSVYNQGGRFLKRDPRRHQWVELNLQQQKDKVSHAIRDANKEIKRRQAEKEKSTLHSPNPMATGINRGQWVAARAQAGSANRPPLSSFANDPARIHPLRLPVVDAISSSQPQQPAGSLTAASVLTRPFMVTREVTNNSSINSTSMNPLMADSMQSLHHESAGSLIVPTFNFQPPPPKGPRAATLVPKQEASGSDTSSDSRGTTSDEDLGDDPKNHLERSNSSSSITLDISCPQNSPTDLNQFSCSSLDLNSIAAIDLAVQRNSQKRLSGVAMDLGESGLSALEMSIASLDLSSGVADTFNRSDPSKPS